MFMSAVIETVRAFSGWTGAGAAPAPTALAEVDSEADAALAAALATAAPAVTAADSTGSASAPATTDTTTTEAAPAGAAAPAAPAPSPAPAAPTVAESGTGQLTYLDLPPTVTWSEKSTGRLVRIALAAEGGLDLDTSAFAASALATLGDERGWQTEDGVRFRFVTPAQVAAGDAVDRTLILASPSYTDRLCAPMSTKGQVSCNSGARSIINSRRWLLGVPWFNSDLELYRQYVVNHEVGHGLGHAHATCPGPGQPSPVMAQQTLGLHGCTPWAWPTNDGV